MSDDHRIGNDTSFANFLVINISDHFNSTEKPEQSLDLDRQKDRY